MRQLHLITAFAMIAVTPAFGTEHDTLTIGMTVSQTGPLNVDSVAQQRGFEVRVRRCEMSSGEGVARRKRTFGRYRHLVLDTRNS